MINRLLLYYPSINIPINSWLKKSILYTDKVASIVPDNMEVSDTMKYLEQNGQYKPIHVEEFVYGQDWSNFENIFRNVIESNEFQCLLNDHQKQYTEDYAIHNNKISIRLISYLNHRNLTLDKRNNWHKIEKNTALIYMSLLAHYISQNMSDLVYPSTNLLDYQEIFFQINKKHIAPRMIFEKCLPTPRDNCDLETIIDFKEKRKTELLKFRKVLDEYEKKINNSESREQISYNMVQLSEKIKVEIEDIEKAMSDHRLSFIKTSLSSLINFKKPGLFVGTAIGSMIDKKPIIGLGVAASILILKDGISSFINKRNTINKSSYSYVFHAKNKGIL